MHIYIYTLSLYIYILLKTHLVEIFGAFRLEKQPLLYPTEGSIPVRCKVITFRFRRAVLRVVGLPELRGGVGEKRAIG